MAGSLTAAPRNSEQTGTLSPHFVRRWTGSVTLGEFLGFCIPAVAGAVTAHRSTAVLVPALIAAGALEGAALGWSQARVLRREVPSLSTRRWVAATAAAAALAWLIGMAPSTFSDTWSTWPVPAVILLAVPLGLILLGSMGAAQAVELRRHLGSAGRWVSATALAWCAGLTAFTAVTTPLWQPAQEWVLTAAIGVLGGLVMATTVAFVTGRAMQRLILRARAEG